MAMLLHHPNPIGKPGHCLIRATVSCFLVAVLLAACASPSAAEPSGPSKTKARLDGRMVLSDVPDYTPANIRAVHAGIQCV
jgi:hypothetical protein